jgi:hypothetical protein
MKYINMESVRKALKEQLLKMKSGEIEFHSYYGHTRRGDKGWSACPVPDKSGWFLGVDRVSREYKESGKPFVDPFDENNTLSRYTISHGSRMDLSDESNRLILKWLVETDELALSYEEGQSDPNKKYFIYDKTTAQKTQLTKFETYRAAMDAVASLPEAYLAKYARLLGLNVADKDPGDIRIMLYEVATSNSKAILDVLADKNADFKDLASRLIEKGVIKVVSKTGEIKFKDKSFPSREAFITFLDTASRENANEADKDLLYMLNEELNKR